MAAVEQPEIFTQSKNLPLNQQFDFTKTRAERLLSCIKNQEEKNKNYVVHVHVYVDSKIHVHE